MTSMSTALARLTRTDDRVPVTCHLPMPIVSVFIFRLANHRPDRTHSQLVEDILIRAIDRRPPQP